MTLIEIDDDFKTIEQNMLLDFSRTFDGIIVFCFSLLVVRLRDEADSVSTGGILIVEIVAVTKWLVNETAESEWRSIVELSRACPAHFHDDRRGSPMR